MALEMEPFGQSFVGICQTYPKLSNALVEKAREDFHLEQRRDSVQVSYNVEGKPVWPVTSLPAEYAYVLYMELRNALFGSSEYAGFGTKE